MRGLPLNRCIPNPIFREHKTIPVTTTSEATDNGWILQVPLRNRIGAGYLFSTEFTSDQEALDNQKKLSLLQNKNDILFCGSYFGYGFHEDGIKSSIEMVKVLDG